MQISTYLLILFILLALAVGRRVVWLAVMQLYKRRAERTVKEVEGRAERVILEAHKIRKKELRESKEILEKAKQDVEILKQQEVIETKKYALQLKSELGEHLVNRMAQMQSRETASQQLEQALTTHTKQLEDVSTEPEREYKQMTQRERLVVQK